MAMAAGQEPDNDAVFADPMLRLPLGRIMGIDYGQRRIGISLCDPTQTIASPLTTLLYRNDDRLGKELSHLVEMHHIIAMVVGWPLNMNGSEGEKNSVRGKIRSASRRPFYHPRFCLGRTLDHCQRSTCTFAARRVAVKK